MPFCTSCGTPNDDTAVACTACNTPMTQAEVVATPISPVAPVSPVPAPVAPVYAPPPPVAQAPPVPAPVAPVYAPPPPVAPVPASVAPVYAPPPPVAPVPAPVAPIYAPPPPVAPVPASVAPVYAPPLPAYAPTPQAYTPPPPTPAPLPQYPNNGDTAPPVGSRYAVMGSAAIWGSIVLMHIPIIGWIFCLAWAFSSKGNINRRNLARATLVFIILQVLTWWSAYYAISSLVNMAVSAMQGMMDTASGSFLSDLAGIGEVLQEAQGLLDLIPS